MGAEGFVGTLGVLGTEGLEGEVGEVGLLVGIGEFCVGLPTGKSIAEGFCSTGFAS